MEATVSYLLILQKYINLKQNVQKKNQMDYVYVIFQIILLLIARKKQD